ncbi:MAG: PAS domain-containing protein [Marinoscillum sp.]
MRFELAARATKETIYEWDCESDLIYWSEGFEETFGYPEKHTNFQNWIDRIHPLDRDSMKESMVRLKKNIKEEYWVGEYRFYNAAGAVVLVEDRGYVDRDQKGKAIRMIGSINDITEQRNFQQRLLEGAIQSEEKERNRLARELHDGIVQELVGCGMKAEYLCMKADENSKLKIELTDLRNALKKITTDTRNVSHNLLSADFLNMSLVDLLDHLNQNLNQGDINFKIACSLYEDVGNVQIKVNLYRTIQELCNNAIKHSGARNMEIKVYTVDDEELHVVAVDDGKGLNLNQKRPGIGLINIRQRIESVGGGITFSNRKVGGLEVQIIVPLRKVMKGEVS